MNFMFVTPPTTPREWTSPACSSVGHSEGLITPMRQIRALGEMDTCDGYGYPEEFSGSWNPFVSADEQKFSSGEPRVKKTGGKFTRLQNNIHLDNVDGCEYTVRETNPMELQAFISCSEQDLCIKYVNCWEIKSVLQLQTSAVLETMADDIHPIDTARLRAVIEAADTAISEQGMCFYELNLSHFTDYKFNSFPCLRRGVSDPDVLNAFIASLTNCSTSTLQSSSNNEYVNALQQELASLENKLKMLQPNQTVLLHRPVDCGFSTPPPVLEITEPPPRSMRALEF
eukprot:TRINITY_DN11380_c0_g2_i1.p1 TRINITY_DN11380_c0_g2~~TRINITY_DN11380_c0_g2_i1.p1  ORF type:complete len:304 (+),score=48.89 TRINITY_DN11380_c0_g2_i1:58-912(+)